MNNVKKIYRKYSNQPKSGWLWVHDHPPELVRRYFLICAICDKFFWHCVINSDESAATGQYQCELRQACELVESLDELTSGEIEDSGFLTDALWAQLEWPALNLLVHGAAEGLKNISEACINMYVWSAGIDEDAAALEAYAEDVFYQRSHVFNEGNYHDSMNWLDIYDMELNATYRHWVESKQPAFTWEIRRKLRCIRRYMAYPLEGQIRRQWCCEAAYLGLTEQQADAHWDLLRNYIAEKIQYHKTRIDLIESALDSRFYPRRVLSGTKLSTQSFAQRAIEFLDDRIRLFQKRRSYQLELF